MSAEASKAKRPALAKIKTLEDARTVALPADRDEAMHAAGNGLYLRLRKNSRTWYWKPPHGGSKERLGEFHDVVDEHGRPSLKAAQKLAIGRRAMIAKDEGDPLAIARAAKTARKSLGAKTLGALLDAYVEDLAARTPPAASARNARYTLGKHVSAEWRRREARHMSQADILEILEAVQLGQPEDVVVVKSVQAFVSAAFGLALRAQQGLNKKISAGMRGFGIRANPALQIDTGVERERTKKEGAPDVAGLRRWLDVLRAEPAGDARDLLLLDVLLSGQRLVQLGHAIVEADPKAPGAWLLHMLIFKRQGGRPHHHLVPLEGEALELVRARGALAEGASLFGMDHAQAYDLSQRAGKLCRDLVRAELARVKATGAAGAFGYFSAGQVRASSTTLLTALGGVDDKHRRQLMAHGLGKEVDDVHYDAHRYVAEKRALLRRFVAALGPVPAAPRGGNVVEFGRAPAAAAAPV